MESRAIENPAPPLGRLLALTPTFRAGEWWEYKLSPLLATAYATAFLLKVPIISLWLPLLLLTVAVAACAAYVSVINDLTDLRDDLASGKANRLARRSRLFAASVLTCCVLPGIGAAFYWRGETLLLSLYLASWVAFTLYSVPPFRLKGRGAWGLLADASGAHLFPSLLAVAVVHRASGAAADAIWPASVAVWSLSYGLRGILLHQIGDLPNDEKIELGTFARRHKVAWLRGLGNMVIFPAELAAFCLMLWHAGSRAALALLCFYALFAFLRKRLWGVKLVVVVPQPRQHFLMQEYYDLYFPLAFLLSSAWRDPLDALVVVAHLILFPRHAAQSALGVKVFADALKLTTKRTA